MKKQTKTFVKTAITEFWEKHKGKRYEDLLPKFAFFASSIDELQNELRPIVEEVLVELNIPTSKILVNVGDPKITSNDDLREFRNLDRASSEKQFILLVNKGKEGWNCRSLFGVALHREPKSKIFVLQATMRCLRAISDTQQTGMVYLSDENVLTLENELEQNFKISMDEFTSAGADDKETVEVRLVPPPVKIKIKRIKKLFILKEKELKNGVDLELEKINLDKYTIKRTERDVRDISKIEKSSIVEDYENRDFSELTLIAEIARYLYKPKDENHKKINCIEIKNVLENAKQDIVKVLELINKHNEILYDHIIPKLFNTFYDIDSYENMEEEEIELVKEPKEGFYKMRAKAELIANINDAKYNTHKSKTFHLDNYCFDSIPESTMFSALLNDVEIEKVWFTGMLTHGQSDFLIRYIDPESHTVRSYYPDFLVKVKTDDDSEQYIIIEVKGDNKIDDAVVKAKADYASQLAGASGMTYQIIKGSKAEEGIIV